MASRDGSGEGGGFKPPLQPNNPQKTDPRAPRPTISRPSPSAEKGPVFEDSPEPQQHWKPRGGLSVMKPMAEPPPPAPAPSPPPGSSGPQRRPATSLDPPAPSSPPAPSFTSSFAASVAPSPTAAAPSAVPAPSGANYYRGNVPGTADYAPTFVPTWETSATRAAAAAAAAAAEPPPAPIVSKPVEAPPKDAQLRSIRTGSTRAQQVLKVAGALLVVAGIAFAGVTYFGARERASGVPTDPATDAKQRELTARGLAERDPLRAITWFDQAITLAPRAPGARDALLGRVSRSLEVKQWDNAAADLALLRIRGDVGPVQDRIDQLTERLRKR